MEDMTHLSSLPLLVDWLYSAPFGKLICSALSFHICTIFSSISPHDTTFHHLYGRTSFIREAEVPILFVGWYKGMPFPLQLINKSSERDAPRGGLSGLPSISSFPPHQHTEAPDFPQKQPWYMAHGSVIILPLEYALLLLCIHSSFLSSLPPSFPSFSSTNISWLSTMSLTPLDAGHKEMFKIDMAHGHCPHVVYCWRYTLTT